MLKSSLCDYSDACILISGTITIIREGDNDAAKRADERNKGLIFKNCASFTDCSLAIQTYVHTCVSTQQSHHRLQHALDVGLATQAHVHMCVLTYTHHHLLDAHIHTCIHFDI